MEWLKEWWSSDAPMFVFSLGLLAAFEGYMHWGIIGAILTFIGWTVFWIGCARMMP